MNSKKVFLFIVIAIFLCIGIACEDDKKSEKGLPSGVQLSAMVAASDTMAQVNSQAQSSPEITGSLAKIVEKLTASVQNITITNSAGSGSATWSGSVDLDDTTGAGTIKSSMTIDAWTITNNNAVAGSYTASVSGKGETNVDIAESSGAMATNMTADYSGDFDITVNGQKFTVVIDYKVVFEMSETTIKAGMTGSAKINGTSYEFDEVVETDIGAYM